MIIKTSSLELCGISVHTGIGAVPSLYIEFNLMNYVGPFLCQKVPLVMWLLHSGCIKNAGVITALSVDLAIDIYIYVCPLFIQIYMYVDNATSILNNSSEIWHLSGLPFQLSLATHQLFAVTVHLSVLPIQLFTRKTIIFPGSISLGVLPSYFPLPVKMTHVLMQ